MKASIWSKIKKLNWLPSPKPLTELSIISILELLCYFGVFIITIIVYQRWTNVAVREINIECESLHLIPGNRVDSSDGDSDVTHYLYQNKSDLGCKIDIDIPFSKVDTIGYSCNFTLGTFHHSHWGDKTSGSCESTYLDSVLFTFKDATDSLGLLNKRYWLFYTNLSTTDVSRLWHHNRRELTYLTSESDTSVKVPQIFTDVRDRSISTSTSEILSPEDIESLEIAEKHGVMSKPRWYDKYDVSQFYFKVNVKSRTISEINLNFRIRGANNYTFIEGRPDSLEGQQLYYSLIDTLKTIQGDRNLLDRTIMLHVQSKELEILQQSRIFGVTALLSALITVFLAFIIIWLCRLIYNLRNKNLLRIREMQRNNNSNESESIIENQEPALQCDNKAEPQWVAGTIHSEKRPTQSKRKKKGTK